MVAKQLEEDVWKKVNMKVHRIDFNTSKNLIAHENNSKIPYVALEVQCCAKDSMYPSFLWILLPSNQTFLQFFLKWS